MICELQRFSFGSSPLTMDENINEKTIDKEKRRHQKDPSGVPTFNHFEDQFEGLEETQKRQRRQCQTTGFQKGVTHVTAFYSCAWLK